MEPEILQLILVFVAGALSGALLLLLWNKLSSGSTSPAAVKQDFENYQNQVEEHFEATSKKFQDMTEQYQDLYKHLSVGATSLCRPDSVAAGLADKSDPALKLEKQEEAAPSGEEGESPDSEESSANSENAAQEVTETTQEPSVDDPAEEATRQAAQEKVDEALGEKTVSALKEAAQEQAAAKS